jgi:hypothetical protein
MLSAEEAGNVGNYAIKAAGGIKVCFDLWFLAGVGDFVLHLFYECGDGQFFSR